MDRNCAEMKNAPMATHSKMNPNIIPSIRFIDQSKRPTICPFRVPVAPEHNFRFYGVPYSGAAFPRIALTGLHKLIQF
jgi:hypothetical protein